jgi:hypothetical protein
LTSLGPTGPAEPDKIQPDPTSLRRVVHLINVTVEPPSVSAPVRTSCNQPEFAGRDRVLRFAEQAIGDWGHTLRTAFLIVVAFVGVVVLVGVLFGFSGALVGAALTTAGMIIAARRGHPIETA